MSKIDNGIIDGNITNNKIATNKKIADDVKIDKIKTFEREKPLTHYLNSLWKILAATKRW